MNYLLFVLLVSAGFAILLHRLAERRNRNPVIWAVLGFAFGPLALPFLYLAGRGKKRNEL